MPTSYFRLPSYRYMHRSRYHPYAVPDRCAPRKAFDAVAYIMPPCVVDVFYPPPPTATFELIEGAAQLAPSAPSVGANAITAFVGARNGNTAPGAATNVEGTAPINVLGLTFAHENDNILASEQSSTSLAQFAFASDDSESQTEESSISSSPTAEVFSHAVRDPLPPLAGLGRLRNFSLALPGQEPASPLDLTGLGEVLNELERPEGEESALVRSDSALLLDFSLAMQRRSRVGDPPHDV